MNNYVFNKTDIFLKRKDLRHNMPEPERRLWARVRNNQLNGYKFRRQYSIGDYIADFYCPSKKLAIELDGESHYQAGIKKKDRVRDNYFLQFNIRILRFTNLEIMKNLEGVLGKVVRTLELPPLAPPNLGGE